jgi:hypothetical protein
MSEVAETSRRWLGFWADVTASVHALFVTFVVWSELLILAGGLFDWAWTRDFTFRIAHLGLVLVVGGQDLLGVICPLTTWERRLRALAGQDVSSVSFIGRCVHSLLMCHLSERTLRTIRLSFAAVVLVTFVVLPPHWPWQSGS